MENKVLQTKKIQCTKCNYEWQTTSNHLYVSCPSCLTKVKQEVKEDDKIND